MLVDAINYCEMLADRRLLFTKLSNFLNIGIWCYYIYSIDFMYSYFIWV